MSSFRHAALLPFLGALVAPGALSQEPGSPDEHAGWRERVSFDRERMLALVDVLDRNPEQLDPAGLRRLAHQLGEAYGHRVLEALVARYPGQTRYHIGCRDYAGPRMWIEVMLSPFSEEQFTPRLLAILGEHGPQADRYILQHLHRHTSDFAFEPVARFLESEANISGLNGLELKPFTGLDSEDVELQRRRWRRLQSLAPEETARFRLRDALALAVHGGEASRWCDREMSEFMELLPVEEAVGMLVDAALRAATPDAGAHLWARVAQWTGIADRDEDAWRWRLASPSILAEAVRVHQLRRRWKQLHPDVEAYLAERPVECVRAMVEQVDNGGLRRDDIYHVFSEPWLRGLLYLSVRVGPGDLRERLLAAESRDEVVRIVVAAVLAGEIENARPGLFKSLIAEGMSDLVRPLVEQVEGDRWLEVLAWTGDTSALGRGSRWNRLSVAAALAHTPEGRAALLQLEADSERPIGLPSDDPVLPALLENGDAALYDVAIRRMHWAMAKPQAGITPMHFEHAARYFWLAGAEPPEGDPLLCPDAPESGIPEPPPWSSPRTAEQRDAVLGYAMAWRESNRHADVLHQQFAVMLRAMFTENRPSFDLAAEGLRDYLGESFAPHRSLSFAERVWALDEMAGEKLGYRLSLPPDFPRPEDGPALPARPSAVARPW